MARVPTTGVVGSGTSVRPLPVPGKAARSYHALWRSSTPGPETSSAGPTRPCRPNSTNTVMLSTGHRRSPRTGALPLRRYTHTRDGSRERVAWIVSTAAQSRCCRGLRRSPTPPDDRTTTTQRAHEVPSSTLRGLIARRLGPTYDSGSEPARAITGSGSPSRGSEAPAAALSIRQVPSKIAPFWIIRLGHRRLP